MRAVMLYEFGPAENLRYEEVPDPVPGPGQVRVAVEAAGVHLVDTLLRAGGYGNGPIPAPRLPTIPGREIAGTVDALGADVGPQWFGRRVVAHLGMAPGGYAASAVTEVERLHEVPAGLGFAEAVAMIGTGRTTIAVLRQAALTAADTAVVLAAAGGIGSLLVQQARAVGATVVGAAGGPDKTARVRDLGADVAVDYARPDWAGEVRRALGGERPATVVFDGVGGTAGRAAVGLLAPGGRHLVYGWAGGPGPVPFAQSELAALGVTSTVVVGPAMQKITGTPEGLRAVEAEALAAAAEGRLVPAVHPFPLADAARAHAALESRATMGKVVLIP
ncbi:zinc-binding dehydrogenase [Actinacidiphila acididurans]|uniref:Zinc-binding dehydrogenase n=1 Tax=Actinacidiphila acididurans TaxID=2784346 RepID=A0ABS2TYZ3_9ACTN|nr:zinc-binding dehydrogenase [Actinacidiphila acididurans]MBM9508545.1 zinc-binding dehydrogenase [Actinacidiphila acididurans]